MRILSQLGPLMLPKSTTDGHTTLSQTGKVVGFSNSSYILGVTDLIYNVGFEHLGWLLCQVATGNKG